MSSATVGESEGVVVAKYLSQLVDEQGNVYVGGELVGRGEPTRPGWHAWGLEAAGPPWSPPTAGEPS